MTLSCKKLYSHSIIPTKHSSSAAGYDLHAAHSGCIKSKTIGHIDTGIEMYGEGLFYGRSGISNKYIMSAFMRKCEGHVVIGLINNSDNDFIFQKNERIGQIVFVECGDFDLVLEE